MSRANLKVTFDVGVDVSDAFQEAIRLATMLNVDVEFDFNGVACTAFPNGSVKRGADEYHEAGKKGSQFQFAFAR